jgi:hypothetical protein
MAEDDATNNTNPERVAKVRLPPPIIRPDEVREIFQRVLKRGRLPDKKACERAAHMISFVARSHRCELATPQERRDALKMRRLVNDLDRGLAAEAKRVNTIFGNRDNVTEVQQRLDRYRDDQIARIEAARSALARLRPVYESQDRPKKTWKDAIWELQVVFETAMRSVTPDRAFGHSQGGPLVRFVHATLPYVVGTEIEIAENTIGTEFKRASNYGTKAAAQSVPVHLR